MSSGIGWLIREMHKRGLRIRSAPIASWTKTGEWVECDEMPDDAFLVRDANDTPGLWWIIESRVFQESPHSASDGTEDLTEQPVDKRHKVEDDGSWTRDWESAAGSLVQVIKSMAWVFEIVLCGEIKPDRHEWLCCETCDVSQCLPKKYGSPSQKRRCHMTPHCEGIVRRLPDIWSIKHPKAKPKPRKTDKRTAGAERMRKKLGMEVESLEDPVDTSNELDTL